MSIPLSEELNRPLRWQPAPQRPILIPASRSSVGHTRAPPRASGIRREGCANDNERLRREIRSPDLSAAGV